MMEKQNTPINKKPEACNMNMILSCVKSKNEIVKRLIIRIVLCPIRLNYNSVTMLSDHSNKVITV